MALLDRLDETEAATQPGFNEVLVLLRGIVEKVPTTVDENTLELDA